MGSEDLAKRRSKERKTRISKEKELRAETWLIVCEGTKTEPNYFKSLLDYVNTMSTKKIKFKVVGTGRNTESLVDSVEELFNFTDKEISSKMIRYGKIFVVFDKDDFTKQAFNNAVNKCINKGYIALWSNECIELWFLLHFNYLDTASFSAIFASAISWNITCGSFSASFFIFSTFVCLSPRERKSTTAESFCIPSASFGKTSTTPDII